MRRKSSGNKKGFTLVESMISTVIIIIIISSVTLANTVAMQTNEAQRKRNAAQDIANDIVNQVVRNDSFEILFDKIDDNLVEKFNSPYKMELNAAELGSLVTSEQIKNLNASLKSLSENATAGIYIRPLFIGSNNADPAEYSKTKLSVTVKIRQNHEKGELFEISTVVSKAGLFSKSAQTRI